MKINCYFQQSLHLTRHKVILKGNSQVSDRINQLVDIQPTLKVCNKINASMFSGYSDSMSKTCASKSRCFLQHVAENL